MRLVAGLLAGLALAVAGLLAAQAPAAPSAPAAPPALPSELRATAAALRDGALQGTGAYEIVRSLTTEVGPRFAGSPGDKAAVEWGLRTLRGLGFANIRAEPVTVPHWERGTIEGRIVAPFPQPVVLAALGGSVATPEAGVEAEVVEAGSLEALDALGERARG
ncbi:MAG TPA: peptidase M28 family protein, partial [Thermoanaerobaculia bacterium]